MHEDMIASLSAGLAVAVGDAEARGSLVEVREVPPGQQKAGWAPGLVEEVDRATRLT